jgi:hypothetical protein
MNLPQFIYIIVALAALVVIVSMSVRILYGLASCIFGMFIIALLIKAGMDIPDSVVCLSLMIAFAGGCAGGD